MENIESQTTKTYLVCPKCGHKVECDEQEKSCRVVQRGSDNCTAELLETVR